jgi:hypothetical protein
MHAKPERTARPRLERALDCVSNLGPRERVRLDEEDATSKGHPQRIGECRAQSVVCPRGGQTPNERSRDRDTGCDTAAGRRTTPAELPERTKCPRPNHAVRGRSRPLLVAPHGAGRLPPERGIDRPRICSAAREHELDHRDVPAEDACAQQATSEPGPAVTAERCPGARAWNPIDEQTVPPLESSYRFRCLRPEEAVNRSRVEAVRAKADLERSDPGKSLPSRCTGLQRTRKDDADRDRR